MKSWKNDFGNSYCETIVTKKNLNDDNKTTTTTTTITTTYNNNSPIKIIEKNFKIQSTTPLNLNNQLKLVSLSNAKFDKKNFLVNDKAKPIPEYQSPYKLQNSKSEGFEFNSSYQSPFSNRLNYLNTIPYIKFSSLTPSSSASPILPTSPSSSSSSSNTKPVKKFSSLPLSSPLPSSPTATSEPVFLSKLFKKPKSNEFKPTPKISYQQEIPKAKLEKSQKKCGPGKLFIFNHDEFQNPQNEYRDGSKNDVKILKETFKKFNLNVFLYENYTVKQIKNQITKIAKEDFTKNSCIIFAILSHGNRMDTISAHDGTYSINDDILFPVLINKTLEDKPKILLVQACKGDFDVTNYKSDSINVKRPQIRPDEIYKFYSTSEGFVAYRNTNGSLFIQCFCEQLKEFGSVKTIREIMESVIKKIKETTKGMQIPSMCVNNTEPYIFGSYT